MMSRMRPRARRSGNFWNLGSAVLLVAAAACGSPRDRPQLRLAKPAAENQDASVLASGRPLLDASEIDSVSMALVGLGVNLADTTHGQLPVVSYILPKLADFAQLIRCPSDASLGDLLKADLGQPDPAKALQRFVANDYWRTALDNPFCSLITESFSKGGQASFVDEFAATGSYRYLARACVSASRVKDKSSGDSVKECSIWVAFSPELANYRNTRESEQAAAAEDIRKVRDRADALGRKIHDLAGRAQAQLAECSKAGAKEPSDSPAHARLQKVLDYGLDLGRDLIDSPEIKNILRNVSVSEISQALKDVFASPKDYPVSCTAAEQSRLEAEHARSELDLLVRQHAGLIGGAMNE